jgi:tRNA(Arg) A34 adenosine deaminase TadA
VATHLSNLDKFLARPVSELVATPRPAAAIEPECLERHRIYALLLMAITRWYWNGNKRGRRGVYGLNPTEAAGDVGNYLGADYLGHNIAALAVDSDGAIIDFDFNHNEIFNSSAEHAEGRLVRRLFSLVQIEDTWNVCRSGERPNRGNLLPDVTIYTTLESCAQCSGIMALATVKQVVYLQQDPGMYFIGNILWHLTVNTDLQAPLPISGEHIGLPHFTSLNERFASFAKQQASAAGTPFFVPANGHEEFNDSLTSFLCTRAAYLVFMQGERDFDGLEPATLRFPSFRPVESALSNAECLKEAKEFRTYATQMARRGTPHK